MEDQEPTASRLEYCPGCGSWNVRLVDAAGAENYLCRECGCCWHLVEGRYEATEPRACPGCASQPVCVRRMWERAEWVEAGHGDDRGRASRHDRWS